MNLFDKKEGEDDGYLLNARDSESKAFSVPGRNIGGKSQLDQMESYPEFKDASQIHKACVIYATAYTETMLTRAKAEDPEIFAMRNISKEEMQ